MGFSCFDRTEIIEQLKSTDYDLLIIGGGITGVGIALDAASRGLRTALVEKNDFAFGTSSRSTKLIHGGLRYLRQFDLALVRDVGTERSVVHRLAPHLVIPEKMVLPITDTSMSMFMTSVGLRLYDWLASVRRKDRRKMLNRKQILKTEPLLRKEGIRGGAVYAEYRTEDARLTLEVAKTAVAHGATVLNHCEVNGFIYQSGLICGVQVVDHIDEQHFDIRAKAIISAAGPWVDIVRNLDNPGTGKQLHLTKGVHLVVPHEKLPLRHSMYFEAGDGRMIFTIPRGRCTYIGTTDTDYRGIPEDVVTTKADAEYLLNAVNQNFPETHLTLMDIESSWAGLRPLINEPGKLATELSRKDEIFVSPSGLISIAGGKLTGYRRMSERVVDLVIAQHFVGRHLKGCFTKKLKLVSSTFRDYNEVLAFIDRIRTQLGAIGLPENLAEYLVQNYGQESIQILAIVEGGQHADLDYALLLAELKFCLRHEMICTLNDFFIRRTVRLYFNIDSVIKYHEAITAEMAEVCHWTSDRMREETEALQAALRRARIPDLHIA